MQNKTTIIKRILSAILCIMLITAIALSASGCGKTVSKGNTEFEFSVTNAEGEVTTYHIKTDKQTVGEALIEQGLIEGEESAYGLYVKTVDGITLDYDTDGKYWAFYVNGEYATSGVDTTEIEKDASYAFKAE